jgi:hypothetical protein
MQTVQKPLAKVSPRNSRVLTAALLSLLLLLSLYYLFTELPRFLQFSATSYGPHYWSFAPWLILHIVAGTTALLIGPFQFISSFRLKYPKVHR